MGAGGVANAQQRDRRRAHTDHREHRSDLPAVDLPTAPSLHVGSLVQIMMLRRLQQAGHKPIVLMGGGTTKVGDPSGKDESRKLLAEQDIAANIAGIRRVFEKFLTFGSGPGDAIMANNADWLNKLNYIDFLRDVGKHTEIAIDTGIMSGAGPNARLARSLPLSFSTCMPNIDE